MSLLTVVIPSYNEEGNVGPLVHRLNDALVGVDAEILYVDDSTDGTVAAVERESATSVLPLAVHHRAVPVGGLAGAVVEGLRRARGELVVVMDGDLQHPPDTVRMILDRLTEQGLEIVVASRYRDEGGADGLAGVRRRLVSTAATVTAKAVFPRALGRCSDPMTGFFGVRRSAIDLDRLNPSGFKILLEVLATHDLSMAEVPFVFGERVDGVSKAGLRQGALFLRQLAGLRLRGWKARPAAASPDLHPVPGATSGAAA